MTDLELLQEIDAWLSFNNSPSKEQISELRNDIKKHITEQLNILHVVQRSEQLPCDHSWKSRFNEKRGSYVICSKCSEER